MRMAAMVRLFFDLLVPIFCHPHFLHSSSRQEDTPAPARNQAPMAGLVWFTI
jgi:hypothetical protein